MSKLREEMLELDDDALKAIVQAHIDEGECWWNTDESWRCGTLEAHERAVAAQEARSLKSAWARSQEPGAAPTHFPGIQTLTIKTLFARAVEPGMVMGHRGKPGMDESSEYVEVISADRCVLAFRRTNDPTGLAFNVTYDPLDSLTVWVVTPVKKEKS